MKHKIFVAGAAGAIGRRLVPLLVRGGFVVTGTTRSPEKAEWLKAAGVEPVIVDVFDAGALVAAVAGAQPDVVIHQLTDLPPGLDPARMGEASQRNARIRRDGTRNLVTAALAAGARRFIAQSIAWAYAPGRTPHVEDAPLDLDAAAPRSVTVQGIAALEGAVLGAAKLEGIVLRYGRLYGPGTGAPAATDPTLSVHVDAAARAALLAIESGRRGAYNIAETDTAVSCEKARRELGWDASFRLDEASPQRAA
ncbi:MAG TPA: NAD(P)-dependent oxidoreductase [Burkholderiales bacterium]|jgi:nucleoside-diphosphate-sugar epimerase|nr:NAD(P)-dependent oxidoreductase [Burkholderiales bacterium]